jgi:hypothetical protein
MARRVNLATRIAKLLKAKFESNIIWSARALMKVYDCQTEHEKCYKATVVDNGIGFSGCDADFGSSLAEKAKDWFEKDGGKRFPSPYGPKLAPWATKLAKKYSKQVATMMLKEKPEAALKMLTEAGDEVAVAAWHQTYNPQTA